MLTGSIENWKQVSIKSVSKVFNGFDKSLLKGFDFYLQNLNDKPFQLLTTQDICKTVGDLFLK